MNELPLPDKRLTGMVRVVKFEGSPPDPYAGLDAVCAADVIQRPVEWLKLGYLAVGKTTLLGGDPEMGKSQIASRLEADTTAEGGGSIIVLSSEDSPGDTIVPRLDFAGADLRRCHIIKASLENGKPRTFSLQNDLNTLGNMIERIGDVRMVRFDPITSYMGEDLDSHRTTAVRAVLEPVGSFAEHYQIAILGITHPPKAAQAKAINSFTGSLAFVAAARLAFIALKEAETDRRLLLAVKNNLGPKAPGLAYRIEGGITSKGISTSRVIWDNSPVTVTADEAIGAGSDRKRGNAMREAKAFLKDALADGPVAAVTIHDQAAAEGIATRTLDRAREKLEIITEKTGFNGGWVWRLP